MSVRDTDQPFFTARWMQAQPVVASVLMGMLRDPATVDDLLQETALTAYQALGTYDRSLSFTAWAVGIARHKAMHWFRSQGRQRSQPLSDEDLDLLAVAAEAQATDLDARALALHACLARLGPDETRIVELHYGDDVPQATIAAQLGMTAGNLRVVLHRVRERLRLCIDRRLGRLS